MFKSIFSFLGYEKHPSEWVQYSHGIKSPDGSKLVYLRFYQKYLKPKGLLRFPDGGRAKIIEHELAFYLYDYTMDSISKTVSVKGRPANPPDAIVSWKNHGIAYWLNSSFNKNYIPSVSWSRNRGIFYIDTEKWRQYRILPYGEFPELSPDCTQAAFLKRAEADCRELWVVNIDGTNARLLTRLQKTRVNWIEWVEMNALYLHTSVAEKKVYRFDFSSGSLIPAEREYRPAAPRITRSELKELLG